MTMVDGTYNLLWWFSLIAPVVIMFVSCAAKTRRVFWIGFFASLVCTYLLSVYATEAKWSIRNATATTETEVLHATSDGANLAFTAILFAPLQAVIFSWFWGWVGRRVWKYPSLANRSLD